MTIKSLNEIPSARHYLNRIGATPRSLRRAVIIEIHGRYSKEIAVIKFEKTGKVTCPDEYAPTAEEKEALEREFAEIKWPQILRITDIINPPSAIRDADPENVYEFRDIDGMIVMVQLRVGDGTNKYRPWTYWDDAEWRCAEPEGLLPFYGIEQLKRYKTIFVHEGAKAARAMHRRVEALERGVFGVNDDFPWTEEMLYAGHIGWIGGAPNAHRSDWRLLNKFDLDAVYIVADNDAQGKAAVRSISKQLRVPCFALNFTQEWPVGFDMADDFPVRMYNHDPDTGRKYYVGPSFPSILDPVTWATDLVPNPRGKPSAILREEFAKQWAYVEDLDLFICVDRPDMICNEKVFNYSVRAFSDSDNTSKLLAKHYKGKSRKLVYQPNNKDRIVSDGESVGINLHVPSRIKSVNGSPDPFLEFMEYLFPREDERYQMLKVCATLIARPDIKIIYAVLLISETHGIGKSALINGILSPLVGKNNTSWPAESDVVTSQFTGWIAKKRLVVINEIYHGHSWKAYNVLKDKITEKFVRVNEKFQSEYTVQNWAHIFATSNSKKALRIEDSDRRWFCPEVNETQWEPKKFEKFFAWLNAGGLGIIKTWAESFGDYVREGQAAPMTEFKREIIYGSKTEAQKEAAALAQAAMAFEAPIALGMKSIESWVKETVSSRVFDSDYDLRKVMKQYGMKDHEDRIKLKDGRLQHVLLNGSMDKMIAEKVNRRRTAQNRDEQIVLANQINDEIRQHLRQPREILATIM